MDEQFDPGSRYQVVEHVKRHDWDGPGLLRSMSCWDGKQQALDLAAKLEPKEPNAVAVRAYDRIANIWVDDGTPAWNPAVHGATT